MRLPVLFDYLSTSVSECLRLSCRKRWTVNLDELNAAKHPSVRTDRLNPRVLHTVIQRGSETSMKLSPS